MTFNISRFKKRSTEEFDIEVVTPMFLGGAVTDDAELRVPSIKGMLRFWWRASCGITDLQNMKKLEDRIFGSMKGKAAFSLLVADSSKIEYQMKMNDRGESFRVHGQSASIVDYLAYGTHKKHIMPGCSFKLKFNFYNEDFKKEILNAFYFFIAFGGLGARSRNGFGSIHWKNIPFKPGNNLNLANYSSFSHKTELYTFSGRDRWVDSLSEIGMAYRTAKLCVENSHAYRKRKLVVAPIMVRENNRTTNKADLERHAKPYFLHVNKLNNGQYKGQILFMPYKYLAGQEGYSTDKLSQYLATCQQMNQKIKELSGGNR